MSVTTLALIFLFIAVIFEAFWAIGLKLSESCTKIVPTSIAYSLFDNGRDY